MFPQAGKRKHASIKTAKNKQYTRFPVIKTILSFINDWGASSLLYRIVSKETITIWLSFAIIVGGLLGLLLKNGIAKRFEKILMQALGLATIFIGAGGVFKYMLVMENGSITTRGTMLLIFSLVIGCILWTKSITIQQRLERRFILCLRMMRVHPACGIGKTNGNWLQTVGKNLIKKIPRIS